MKNVEHAGYRHVCVKCGKKRYSYRMVKAIGFNPGNTTRNKSRWICLKCRDGKSYSGNWW